jgi:ATP-dependent Clp protease ATP-binding subunit ClpX
MRRKKDMLVCSFCGRTSDTVEMIPAADGVSAICVDCVKLASDMVSRHEKKSAKTPELPPTPAPKEIKEFLDQHVIGHDEVKKVLSVAVHNHYRRLEASAANAKKIGQTAHHKHQSKAHRRGGSLGGVVCQADKEGVGKVIYHCN